MATTTKPPRLRSAAAIAAALRVPVRRVRVAVAALGIDAARCLVHPLYDARQQAAIVAALAQDAPSEARDTAPDDQACPAKIAPQPI